MRPALDERAAPDPVSGAVSFHPDPRVPVPTLSARDFWRAVGATVLAGIRLRLC